MASAKRKIRTYSKKTAAKISTVMREWKRGALKGGKGKRPRVKKRTQAIAIAISEARKAGAKVPRRRSK